MGEPSAHLKKQQNNNNKQSHNTTSTHRHEDALTGGRRRSKKHHSVAAFNRKCVWVSPLSPYPLSKPSTLSVKPIRAIWCLWRAHGAMRLGLQPARISGHETLSSVGFTLCRAGPASQDAAGRRRRRRSTRELPRGFMGNVVDYSYTWRFERYAGGLLFHQTGPYNFHLNVSIAGDYGMCSQI